MRVALISHGLPPYERTGVETHVAHSAQALVAAGVDVLVCARRSARDQSHLAERVEHVDGYAVHWLNDAAPTRNAIEQQDPPGVVQAFDEILAREQPDLCHFHHLQGWGPACLEAARARRIPTLFTAHDFGALCHRTTMLRPDLARCETVGDTSACARCDLGTSFLNTLPELGDWQSGVAPASLEPALESTLAALLDGRAPAGLAATHVTRRGLDRAQLTALRSCALVLAPSDVVATRLRAWGLNPECVRRFECGVDVTALRAVPPIRTASAEPLRFGFIGGASKHKGLAVLLEAFADVRPAPDSVTGSATNRTARLAVYADGTDRPHVAHLRGLAQQAGAEWRGAFEARDLASVLAEIDVLCVPSQWDENAPFVVREAFAAGRPVIASRLGGLAESVRDGRDGLLVEAADRGAWTRALEGLAGARARVLELAAGIAPTADLARQTGALVDVYREILERSEAPARTPLAHLSAFEARHEELMRSPLSELSELVAGGLADLAAAFGVAAPAAHPVEDDELRERLRDERRRAEWLERGAREQSLVRVELEREVAWLRDEQAVRDAELAWLREQVAGSSAEASLRAQELERLRADRAALADEYARLAQDLTARREHDEWLAQQTADLAARLEVLDAELRWRASEMEAARGAGGELWRALVRRSALGRRMSGWGGDV